MEADFNFGNKLFVGSRMTYQVRSHIPLDLYGGVKGRRVESMALSRRLLADILRQMRCPGAIASVDAQSCYDRITYSTASLCCQQWGVPPRIMETMLRTIQGMRFYLRTGHGDSSQYYGGGSSLFQGICQGNGAGPAVWLAISAVFVLILREKSQCKPIRGAFSAASLVIIALLFVDDTDLFVQHGDSNGLSDVNDLVARLQRVINAWHGLLHASGGSLSAEKCSWTLAAFRWKGGKWFFHSAASLPATIYVDNENSVEQQAMDGSMTGQLAVLSNAIDQWCKALSQGTIPRHIAWAAIRIKIWPSTIRFPLVSSTITQSQGRQLMGRL